MPMPTHINGKPVKTGSWTPAEDKLLGEWQGKLGNRWSAVAKKIPGRTGQQCAQRWRHKVNPNIRKEKWSEDEDRKLLKLVKQYGNAWAEISRCLDGRTDQQCMGRWRRHLDPTIRRDSWAPQEDQALHELYQQYGSQWSQISLGIPGRTAQQCRARFFQVEGPGDRPGVRQGSKSRSSRWSQGLSDDEDGEGEPDEAELDADLAGSASAAHRGKRAPTGSASTLNPASSPSGGGFTRRWQGKKRRGQQQPPRQASDDSDLDAEAQAALEQLASPCSRHTARDEELEYDEEEDVRPPVRSLADKLGLTPPSPRGGSRRKRGYAQVECEGSDASDRDQSRDYQRGSSSCKRSGSKRSSAGLMSPPFLSPMRHCHSMPSGSRLLGRQNEDLFSPQSVHHRHDGEGHTPARHPSHWASPSHADATPRHGARRSRSPAGQRAEGVRWRTASPSGLNILQMMQSPQGARVSLHESPALSDKGLVTPEWARRRVSRHSAVTAPAACPGSTGRSLRGPVARRLVVDEAHDPHHSHHWDQAADGPAAGQRSYSVPVRRQAVCETDQYMSDLPEETEGMEVTDSDREGPSQPACDPLRQLCVAATSLEAAALKAELNPAAGDSQPSSWANGSYRPEDEQDSGDKGSHDSQKENTRRADLSAAAKLMGPQTRAHGLASPKSQAAKKQLSPDHGLPILDRSRQRLHALLEDL